MRNKHWQWISKPRCRQEFLQSHHCFSISSLNLSLAFNTCFIFFCDTFMTMTQLIHQRREVEESLKQKMERQTNWDSVHFYSVKSFWPFQFSISTSSFTILSGPGPYSQNFLRSRICVSKTYVNLNKVWYSQKNLRIFLSFCLSLNLSKT